MAGHKQRNMDDVPVVMMGPRLKKLQSGSALTENTNTAVRAGRRIVKERLWISVRLKNF